MDYSKRKGMKRKQSLKNKFRNREHTVIIVECDVIFNLRYCRSDMRMNDVSVGEQFL